MAPPAPAIPKQPRNSTISFVATQQLCYNFMKHPDTHQLTHATVVQTCLVRLPPAHHQHPWQTEQLHQTASTSKQSAMAASGLLAAGGSTAAGGHPPACITVAGTPATAAGSLPAAGGCSPACATAADGCAILAPAPTPQHPQQVALILHLVLAQTLLSGNRAHRVKLTRRHYNNYNETHSNFAAVLWRIHCDFANSLSTQQPTPNQSPSLSDRGDG